MDNLNKELEIFKKQIDIQKLEIACSGMDQVECPTENVFSPGLYTRIMKVPAGTFVIGKRHRGKTLNIMTKGRALVYVGDGIKAKEIIAPFTFVSDPEVKKMAFFLEDSEWINVHPTEETDLEKIEKEFIIPEDEYVLLIEERNKIEG